MYLAQIKDTAANLGKLYCLQCNIKLYVENCTLFADFPESEQHAEIAQFENGGDMYEVFFKEYLYPNLQEYKDFCDSWIITEATA